MIEIAVLQRGVGIAVRKRYALSDGVRRPTGPIWEKCYYVVFQIRDGWCPYCGCSWIVRIGVGARQIDLVCTIARGKVHQLTDEIRQRWHNRIRDDSRDRTIRSECVTWDDNKIVERNRKCPTV